MEELLALKEIDWFQVAVGVIAAFLFVKFIVTSYEWVVKKTGLETKKMREKREDHELLIKTSKNLAALQAKHDNDEDKLETCLSSFIAEQKKENDALRAEMKKFAENRINDRQVSIDREKRLNGRIDDMATCDKSRDENIYHINEGLKKLTELFVDKQINDYRWEIINFATALCEKKPCTKEAFKHCFSTYERYEKVLEEYGLENGEVEISMEIINEAYKEKMTNGF
jgi:sulfur transfer protein SufE